MKIKATYLFSLFLFGYHQALATTHVPLGFEFLLDSHVEQIEVSLLGHSLGLFAVIVQPESVQFTSPRSVLSTLEKCGLLSFTESERHHVIDALSHPLPRNNNLVCDELETENHRDCGYVTTNSISTIFNENTSELLLFITPKWLVDEKYNKSQRWLSPTAGGINAFIHHQSINLSTDRDSHNLTLSGIGSLGLGVQSYLGGDWAAVWSNSQQKNSRQAWFNNIFFRQDVGKNHYLQMGRMDQRNLYSPLGGNFDFNFLPLNRFDGVRLGTTQAYINKEIELNASPVIVQATHNTRIDIYRENQLLGSQYFSPGVHSINTKYLPAGSYQLTLKFYENGLLQRSEKYPFSKGGGNFNSQYQWFIQGGEESTPGSNSRQHGERVMATGFLTGLAKNVSLSEGISLKSDVWYNETRLGIQQAVLDGVMDFSIGWGIDSDHGRGDSESFTYNDGFSFSLWRKHSTKWPIRQTSMNTSLSVPLGGGTVSLGYSTSQTQGLVLQTGKHTYRYDENIEYGPRMSSPSSHSKSILANISPRSFNWNGVNIGANGGLWRTNNDGGVEDNGLFANVSLSYISQPLATTSPADYTSVGTEMSSSRNNKMQTALFINHSRTWQQDQAPYRELSLRLSNYNDESWSGSLSGRMNGRLGDLNTTVSNSHEQDMGNFTSFTAGYSSLLAISSQGLSLGSGQNGEHASGMVVVVDRNGEDLTKEKVVSIHGNGQNFNLGFGQQSLMSIDGYTVTNVSIDDTGVNNDGISGIKTGGEAKNYFFVPGHLLVHNIDAKITRIYSGRAIGVNRKPLTGAQPLNGVLSPLGTSARFTLQSEKNESNLWLLFDNQILRCPLRVHKHRDVLQIVGDVQCEVSDRKSLPLLLQQSDRVTFLLTKTGLKPKIV